MTMISEVKSGIIVFLYSTRLQKDKIVDIPLI